MKSSAQRDAELALEAVRAETSEAARQLSEAIASREGILAAIRSEQQAAEQAALREREELDARATDLAGQEAAFHEAQQKGREALAAAQKQGREAMSELRRLNGWIATAAAEAEAKRSEAGALDAKIAEKRAAAQGLQAIQEDCEREEKRRDAIRLEATLAFDEGRAKAANLQAEARDAEARTMAALDETARAVSERDRAVKEKERIRSDLEIYIRRVEEKHHEAFPGLRMTL